MNEFYHSVLGRKCILGWNKVKERGGEKYCNKQPGEGIGGVLHQKATFQRMVMEFENHQSGENFRSLGLGRGSGGGIGGEGIGVR